MPGKLYLIHPEHSESGTLETLPKTQGIVLMNNSLLQLEFNDYFKPITD